MNIYIVHDNTGKTLLVAANNPNEAKALARGTGMYAVRARAKNKLKPCQPHVIG
jgi:hypothetical protein